MTAWYETRLTNYSLCPPDISRAGENLKIRSKSRRDSPKESFVTFGTISCLWLRKDARLAYACLRLPRFARNDSKVAEIPRLNDVFRQAPVEFLRKNSRAPIQFLSGWRDSNSRPPAPKAGALAGLRYTPIFTLSLTSDSLLVKLKDEVQSTIHESAAFQIT